MTHEGQPIPQPEPSIVSNYDVFYTRPDLDPTMEEGWYFWFIDQYEEIMSAPIGPFADEKDVQMTANVAVKTYYDNEDESGDIFVSSPPLE